MPTSSWGGGAVHGAVSPKFTVKPYAMQRCQAVGLREVVRLT